jgi:hypothetical protein
MGLWARTATTTDIVTMRRSRFPSVEWPTSELGHQSTTLQRGHKQPVATHWDALKSTRGLVHLCHQVTLRSPVIHVLPSRLPFSELVGRASPGRGIRQSQFSARTQHLSLIPCAPRTSCWIARSTLDDKYFHALVPRPSPRFAIEVGSDEPPPSRAAQSVNA